MNSKTALITGASSGLGEAFAHIFAKNGYDLVVTARSSEKLKGLANELKQKYNADTLVISGDLSQHDFADVLYNTCLSQNLQIDVLVNNAGFGDYSEFYKSDWVKVREMIDLNITALTHLTKLFLPDMVERKKGKILNIASTAAFLPGPLMAVYYASKAYVLSFTEALAEELKGTGVTVTVHCPGPTITNFQKKAAMEDSKLVKGNPSKRLTATQAAEFGFNELMSGKTTAIQGVMNNIIAFLPRLLPRSIVPGIVRRSQERISK